MIDLSWVLPEHQPLAAELLDELDNSIQEATTSKAFIQIQLDPAIPWPGHPEDITETWLSKRPAIVAGFFQGEASANEVGKALRAHLRSAYRPRKGGKPGTKPREPKEGVTVPEGVSGLLDEATWDAMRKSGSTTDLDAIRQAVKVPAPTDVDGADKAAVLLSAGTVTGEALEARYTAIQGNLYWSDIRNSLELWVRARPELLDAYEAWEADGKPRAWDPKGEWRRKGNGRVEHNPSVLLRVSAFRTALSIIQAWKQDRPLSLDAIVELYGEARYWEATKRPPTQGGYVMGLRDD